MGTNVGQNTTIENKTVMNKSGKYTYYDLSTYQNIVITSDNYDTMAHILRTLNKIDITPNTENLTVNLTSLNATNDTNNTTTTSTQKTQSMTKKSTSKSKTSSSSSSSSKPKDTVNGGAKDLGGDYYQTADGEVHHGYKMYDHPGDSRYYHPYYS